MRTCLSSLDLCQVTPGFGANYQLPPGPARTRASCWWALADSDSVSHHFPYPLLSWTHRVCFCLRPFAHAMFLPELALPPSFGQCLTVIILMRTKYQPSTRLPLRSSHPFSLCPTASQFQAITSASFPPSPICLVYSQAVPVDTCFPGAIINHSQECSGLNTKLYSDHIYHSWRW